MSKKSHLSAVPTDGPPPPTLLDLQRFVEDCASELETIRCRVAMIQAALKYDTGFCDDAARLLQVDVDNGLHEYVERARKLSGCWQAPETPTDEALS